MSSNQPKIIFSSISQFQTLQNKLSNYSIKFPPNSLYTKQSFASECDINTIMARYQSTGEMPVLNQRAPQYLDLDGSDFQTSMELVAGAQTLFMELPSKLRNRFNNDPGAFLDFCSQESNRAEMQALGLLKPGLPASSEVVPVPTQPPTSKSEGAPS